MLLNAQVSDISYSTLKLRLRCMYYSRCTFVLNCADSPMGVWQVSPVKPRAHPQGQAPLCWKQPVFGAQLQSYSQSKPKRPSGHLDIESENTIIFRKKCVKMSEIQEGWPQEKTTTTTTTTHFRNFFPTLPSLDL